MKFIFLTILAGFFMVSCSQNPEKALIQKYFNAFNQSNFNDLKELLCDDFEVTEGNFTLCTSINEFQTVFQWDSIFNPTYEILNIQELDGKMQTEISKTDIRVAYLHDTPLISNVSFEFKNGKISKQIINDYKEFDIKKWGGRLKDIATWIKVNHAELNGFERDITPRGAENYIKAIDLYQHRDLGIHEDIFVDNDIQLIHLKDSVFIHVSWSESEKYGRFPSNGLVVVKNGEAILVDTPMDNDKTKRLYQYLKNKMDIEVSLLIPGHFHDDCMGGISFLHAQGVHSLANILTIEKCTELGLEAPKESFDKKKDLDFNGLPVQCAFWGGGHSFDNITVWLPNNKILFGGCFVKNMNSKGLGNLTDAVVNEWEASIVNVKNAYPDAECIVPGHGEYGGIDLLNHTIDLVQNYKLIH